MLSTQVGKQLGEAVLRRKGRFIVDPTRLLGRASITLNFMRLAIIGRQVARVSGLIGLVEHLAHEASHLAQRRWSDSFEQEYQAFVAASHVVHELGLQDSWGWAPDLWALPLEDAAHRIQWLFPDHPLYGQSGSIPLRQKRGWQAVGPMLRQAWALVRYAVSGDGPCDIRP